MPRSFHVYLFFLLWFTGSQVATAAGFDGKVEWAQRIALSVPVSGVVETVAVDTGQPIKKGQVLVQLEQTPFVAELASAKAARTQDGGAEKEQKTGKGDAGTLPATKPRTTRKAPVQRVRGKTRKTRKARPSGKPKGRRRPPVPGRPRKPGKDHDPFKKIG